MSACESRHSHECRALSLGELLTIKFVLSHTGVALRVWCVVRNEHSVLGVECYVNYYTLNAVINFTENSLMQLYIES
jgi:hypothetical protein